MKQFTHISLRDAYINKHRPECLHTLADSYWRILLCVALVITLLSAGFGILKLSEVVGDSSNSSVQGASAQSLPKFNKTQLQNTLTAFNEREVRFNALKTSAQKISDPSR